MSLVFFLFIVACTFSVGRSYRVAYQNLTGVPTRSGYSALYVLISTVTLLGLSDEPEFRVKVAIVGAVALLVIEANELFWRLVAHRMGGMAGPRPDSMIAIIEVPVEVPVRANQGLRIFKNL